jgi:hypothetical protein
MLWSHGFDFSSARRIAATVALAACTPACLFTLGDDEDDDGVVYTDAGYGAVVVDWTIDGAKDPALCDLSGAAAISIELYTINGAYAGTYEQDCDVFGTSIGLYPDRYEGDAVLIDRDGAERTTPVFLAPFRIYGDDELILPIDFPSDSFY